MGVVGNILVAGTVHGVCTVDDIVSVHCTVSVCLQILNSFNNSGTDEAIYALQIWQNGSSMAGFIPVVTKFPERGVV